jgi:hypothetical protein
MLKQTINLTISNAVRCHLSLGKNSAGPEIRCIVAMIDEKVEAAFSFVGLSMNGMSQKGGHNCAAARTTPEQFSLNAWHGSRGNTTHS